MDRNLKGRSSRDKDVLVKLLVDDGGLTLEDLAARGPGCGLVCRLVDLCCFRRTELGITSEMEQEYLDARFTARGDALALELQEKLTKLWTEMGRESEW